MPFRWCQKSLSLLPECLVVPYVAGSPSRKPFASTKSPLLSGRRATFQRRVSGNPEGSCVCFEKRSLKEFRSFISKWKDKYAEGKLKDDISKFGSAEEKLKEGVEIASGSLVFESDGISFFAREVRHGQFISAVPWQSFPGVLDLSSCLS